MAGSLRAAFKAATVTAFNALSDIPESATYRSMDDDQAAYNPATGTVTEDYTDYTVSFVFTSPKLFEISNSGIMQSSDVWALVPTTNLTPTPKLIDVIIRDDAEWQVVDIRTDPAAALWKILIRKG